MGLIPVVTGTRFHYQRHIQLGCGGHLLLDDPYTDPLNVLQVELLGRSRNHAETLHPELDQALMVTIAGIAAGMRNTG